MDHRLTCRHERLRTVRQAVPGDGDRKSLGGEVRDPPPDGSDRQSEELVVEQEARLDTLGRQEPRPNEPTNAIAAEHVRRHEHMFPVHESLAAG